jgi:two-component system phosphate regulon sensor histidine kinase PhoR
MFWRLFSAYGALLLASIGALGVVIVRRVEASFEQQLEDSLRTKAVLLREIVRGQPSGQGARWQDRIQALREHVATRITLLDRAGNVLADSEANPTAMDNHGDRPEIREAQDHPFGTASRPSKTLGKPLMYVALRVTEPANEVAYVRVALPLTEIRDHLAELNRLVWSAAGITALIAMFLAFWLARGVAEPVQELIQGAQRISTGDLSQKVYAAGGGEVGRLARTFNQMSEQLADQFAQLEEDRHQLRAILSGMVEGVIALDAEQRILFANERAAQLLGFPAQASVGRNLWAVVRQRSFHELVQRALKSAEPCQEELPWTGTAGRSLLVHAARLEDSAAKGAVLVLHDTSELRRLERVRQEFVANVSHELKTPLAVIRACVETLLEGALDDVDNRGQFLDQIMEQSERLNALILDLLSLARIESGAEAFEFQNVRLDKVATACLERHRARAESKGQRLEAAPAAPGQAPAVAWADEEAVGQILDNLVDNAVKYTPAGGSIRVWWWADAEQAAFRVEDNGIGIAERHLPRLFERFYRVDKARSRELGGTGLGLSIVKHLVQAMHGSVRATSQAGQGSAFTVMLPRGPATENNQRPHDRRE